MAKRNRINVRRIQFQQDRMLRALERRWTLRIQEALIDQVNYAARNGGLIVSDSLEAVFSQMYEDAMMQAYTSQMQVFEMITGRIRKDRGSFFVNVARRFITEYIANNIASKVSKVNEYTRRVIQEAILQGSFGTTEWSSVASLIENATTEIASRTRALMIARTELANAINTSKDQSKEDWKQETGDRMMKTWIHRGAKNPRDWHIELDNGEYIHEDDNFVLHNPHTGNTEYAQRPHAENLSAENVINCSCQVFYAPEFSVQYLS